jgi:uncharacterized membrane protein
MKNKNINTTLFVRLTMLTAVIFLMAFTPFGYFRFAAVEVTFLTVPVAVGAILLGPGAGAFLGGVFGITSFLQCFGISWFGTMLFGINPVYTFIICLVPRIAMGWLTGLMYKNMNKHVEKGWTSLISAAVVAPVLNTVFFMFTLIVLFGSSSFIMELRGDMLLVPFLVAFVGFNGLMEAIVCPILSVAVCKVAHRFTVKA